MGFYHTRNKKNACSGISEQALKLIEIYTVCESLLGAFRL